MRLPSLLPLLLPLMTVVSGTVSAQTPLPVDLSSIELSDIDLSAPDLAQIDLSRVDRNAVLSAGGEVVLRASPDSVDALFQAVAQASREPDEADTLCALFEPDAPRDLDAFQHAVDRLGADSRVRLATAFVAVAQSGLEGQRQPYEPEAARRVLSAAAVTATLLHEGFMTGLTATGTDRASREGRCRAFRQLVDVLQDRPRQQRVLATRWLLNEGLTLVARSGGRDG